MEKLFFINDIKIWLKIRIKIQQSKNAQQKRTQVTNYRLSEISSNLSSSPSSYTTVS